MYERKKDLLPVDYHDQTFQLRMNLLDAEMYRFLAFVRFLVFDDESNLDAYCYVAKTRANQIAAGSDFRGYFDAVSAENEAVAWSYIKNRAAPALQSYKEQKDVEAEAKAEGPEALAMPAPIRLCVALVRSEQKVLHFLLDCAAKAAKVLAMSKKEALKEINSWTDAATIEDYFKKNVANQLLTKKE